MQERQVWRIAKVWLVGLIVFVAATAVAVVPPGVAAPTVEASVLHGKDDKDKDKNKKDKDEQQDADHTLNGQVLEINTLKDPPEMIVGTVDGQAVVRVLKTDEIALNGVEIGDYVEVSGEKIHELLFEATEISVDKTKN